jgi:hypothetical protein
MARSSLKYQTQEGRAQYPWLNTADTEYDKDGIYHTKLIVPAADAKELIEDAKTFAKEELGKKADTANMPFKVDDVTGAVIFNAKTQFVPKYYDSSGALLTGSSIPKVYKGAILKIGGTLTAYDKGSIYGITMNLTKVQIIDVGDPSHDDGEGFDAVEGGFIAQAVAADTFDDSDSGDADGEASSNYNF